MNHVTSMKLIHFNDPTLCAFKIWDHEEPKLSEKFEAIRHIMLSEFSIVENNILQTYNKRTSSAVQSLHDIASQDITMEDLQSFSDNFATLVHAHKRRTALQNLLLTTCNSLSTLRPNQIMRLTINTLTLLSQNPATTEFTKEQVIWAMEHQTTEEEFEALYKN